VQVPARRAQRRVGALLPTSSRPRTWLRSPRRHHDPRRLPPRAQSAPLRAAAVEQIDHRPSETQCVNFVPQYIRLLSDPLGMQPQRLKTHWGICCSETRSPESSAVARAPPAAKRLLRRLVVRLWPIRTFGRSPLFGHQRTMELDDLPSCLAFCDDKCYAPSCAKRLAVSDASQHV
jgi:hypothetical protein